MHILISFQAGGLSFPLVGNPSVKKNDSGQAGMIENRNRSICPENNFQIPPSPPFSKGGMGGLINIMHHESCILNEEER